MCSSVAITDNYWKWITYWLLFGIPKLQLLIQFAKSFQFPRSGLLLMTRCILFTIANCQCMYCRCRNMLMNCLTLFWQESSILIYSFVSVNHYTTRWALSCYSSCVLSNIISWVHLKNEGNNYRLRSLPHFWGPSLPLRISPKPAIMS